MSKGTPQITFRAGSLLPELQKRTKPGSSLSQTARRDLDRYYALIEHVPPVFASDLPALRAALTRAQGWTPENIRYFWVELEGTSDDRSTLAGSIKALDARDLRALIDWLEQDAIANC